MSTADRSATDPGPDPAAVPVAHDPLSAASASPDSSLAAGLEGTAGLQADTGLDPGDAAHIALLAGLRGMGPVRLRLLLRHHDPAEAVAVLSGDARAHPSVERVIAGELGSRWRADLAATDVAMVWDQCVECGVQVIPYGHRDYPPVLATDPAPPAVLFVRGDPGSLTHRRVAVVGTRSATRSGLATARALGEGLAAAGVAVVSGLARGIDGAVHRGVVDAGGIPIAVVGNGPDAAYPRQHAQLWEEVIGRGALLSEWPPGTGPDAFRFPMRNRIIAALAEVLVVVESRESGGSLLTVDEAIERSVTVMAVPGSPRSRASAGTNRLLCDGAAPVTCTEDILVALGLDTRRRVGSPVDTRPIPSGLAGRLLEACRESPQTLDQLVERFAQPVAEIAMALARLERSGRVVETRGWFESAEPRTG